MGAIKKEKKLMLLDSKQYRQDFMQGHGKANARDSLTRQVPGTRRQLDANKVEELYAGNSLAKNIVDIPSEDLTRAGWIIKTENTKLRAQLESKLRQLKVKERFEKQFIYRRLYGDGFVSIGTIESSPVNLGAELQPELIKSIPYLNTFSNKKITNVIIDEDVFSARYGQIASFEVMNNPTSKIELLDNKHVGSVNVHYSRVLHQQEMTFEGDKLGTSLLESMYDILTVLDTSLWSVGQMLYDYAFKVYKSADVDSLSENEKAELCMRMDYKFRTEALALIGADEDLTKEGTNTSGIGELLDFVWDYLAGAARMPKTVLRGQEAGTVTGAQYDVMNYYSRIASIQENQLRPQLEYLVRLLMWATDECGGRIDPDTIEWSIEFNPLWNVDAKTDAEIRKLTAETDKIYVETGVADPEEIYNTRFGRFGVTESSKFNADNFDESIANEVYKRYKESVQSGQTT